MNKSLHSQNLSQIVILESIFEWYENSLYALLFDDCSYQSFAATCINVKILLQSILHN